MKKTDWIMIFAEDTLHIHDKGKEYIFQNDKSLGYGKIIDPQHFIECLTAFLKQQHLKRSVFGDNVKVIHNDFWNESDKTIATSALNYLGFSHINFINEISLYENKSEILWITYYPTYITFYYLERDYKKIIYLDDNFQRKEILFILKQIIKKYTSIKKIYLSGTINKELQESIEKTTKIHTYMIKSNIDYFQTK